MPGWLSRNTFTASDYIHADDLNNLANDDRTWGGDVNGGGYHLSNVILQGSGGFSSYVSPMEVTPGSTGTTCLQLDQTVGANHVARWTVCKDATAETGSNTGSNFAVGRYTDAGVVIDTPIAINRATGLITMGAQQWAGAVNGGGQTLSNVVIPGTLADPTTTKGDLLARSASALARLAIGADGFILTADSSQALGVKWAAAPATGVPTSRNINTGVGLSGGGPLTADLNLAGVVFGASGGSHKSGDVPDPGATAQATRYLREDATWAIPSGTGGGMTDPTTTKGDLIVHGSGITRLPVGTDGQALLADSTQTLGVRWGAASGGGFWLAGTGGAIYYNGGSVGIGTSTPAAMLEVAGGIKVGGGLFKPPSGTLTISFQDGVPSSTGTLSLSNTLMRFYNNAAPVQFDANSNAGNPPQLYLALSGNVGIGTPAPRSALSVITNAPSTPATATQITIGEISNNGAYQLAVGYYYTGSSYQGVIQTMAGVPSGLLLNPAGGNVGIGVAVPRSVLSIIAGNPSTFATASQITIGEPSNNSGYQLAVGAASVNGSWAGVIQQTAGGVGSPLYLQPSGGAVRVNGTAVPGYALDVTGDVNCTGAFRVNGTAIGGGGIAGVGWLASGVGVSTRPNCNFTAGGTIGFSVTDVPGSNRVDVFYSVGSDVRLKRNLIPLTGGLDLINRLRPYEFEYNGLGGREEGRRAVSVLAQDLQAIYPQGVTTYPAKLRPEDAETTDLLTFDTLDILFHAALAIQQLSARIETLEKRLKGN